jgi:signal transduction histidine kinase
MPADVASDPGPGGAGGLDEVALTVLEAARAWDLVPSLERIAEGARRVTGARYAAVGLPGPDPEEFAHFVSAGLTSDEIDAIGPLPRAHGLLGAVLADAAPLRVADIRRDRRARRWWPRAHPQMTALLGVPLLALLPDVPIGALYAADGPDGPGFTAGDEDALVRLAAAVAPLVRALRLADESRVLIVAAERARIARDLHDALSQTLFSIALRADAARSLLGDAGGAAALHVDSIAELASAAHEELGALIGGLRPPAVEEEGLARALERLVDLLDRLGGPRVVGDVGADPPLPPDRAREAFLILQEALVNAVRHASAREVRLTVRGDGDGVRAEVRDDGRGFDPHEPGNRRRSLGLTAMHERAGAIGARLTLESTPGEGTRVTLEVPGG